MLNCNGYIESCFAPKQVRCICRRPFSIVMLKEIVIIREDNHFRQPLNSDTDYPCSR